MTRKRKKTQRGGTGFALIVLVLVCAMTLVQRFMKTTADAGTVADSVGQAVHSTDSSVDDAEMSDTSESVKLELPRNVASRVEQVIEHVGYTTSYNKEWLIPNWVAYDLKPVELVGNLARKNGFVPDPDVVGATAVHGDYTNSGYSRGHMAPAADMKWSQQAMDESFYLSNVCPQKAELNAGAWEKVERAARRWAKESVVYICCGPLVETEHETIGRHKVAVPSRFFKVLCMQRKGKWQAIGFIMPNEGCSGSYFDYAMSVDEVERVAGLDFFYLLPDEIENEIEADYNQKDWN